MTRFIYLVAEDIELRNSLRALLLRKGCLHLMPYASGDAFLASQPGELEGVVLLDNCITGRSGTDVLESLAERRVRWPVIMLNKEGDANTAVLAMKLGAFDYLEKPVRMPELLTAIDAAFAKLDRADEEERFLDLACQRVARLSDRELDVLKLVVAGLSNKQIAHRLEISLRTVEVHRAHVMTKLEASSIAEAIRLAIAARITPLHVVTT